MTMKFGVFPTVVGQVDEYEKQKEVFGRHRFRCLCRPRLALDTLRPFALLNLRVAKARNLFAKWTGVTGGTASPYLEIFLDDVLKFQSKAVLGTLHPSFPEAIPPLAIMSPISVVRIQIVDYCTPVTNAVSHVTRTDNRLGFVEFVVAELHHNVNISGWMELRFMEWLQKDAHWRISLHKQQRDEDRALMMDALGPENDDHMSHPAGSRDGFIPMNATDIDAQPLLNASSTREKVDPCVTLAAKKKKKKGGLMPWCGADVDTRQFPEHEFDSNAEVDPTSQLNAGEVYVEVFLNCNPWDEWWAYCLPYKRQKWYPVMRGPHVGDGVDLQELIEHGTFLKENLIDAGLRPVIDTVVYIMTWRNVLLSLFLYAWCLALCFIPDATFSSFLLFCAFMLMLLRNPKMRSEFASNPATLPLNDYGLACVALLQSACETKVFFKRVLSDMNGHIKDADKFHRFAVCAVDSRKPTKSFADFQKELKEAGASGHNGEKPWIEFHGMELKVGMRVKVSSPTGSQYEQQQGVVKSERRDDGNFQVQIANSGNPPVWIHESYIRPKRDLLQLPRALSHIPAMLLPSEVQAFVDNLQPLFVELRYNFHPVHETVYNFLTWRNPFFNYSLILGLVICVALLLCSRIFLTAARDIISIAIRIVLVSIIFIVPSWWFAVVRTSAKATYFCCKFRRMRRSHYDMRHWAFLRPGGFYANEAPYESLTSRLMMV